MTHGLTIIESTTGARPITVPSMAIIGLIATATATAGAVAALDAAFPLNTPVLVTDVAAAAGQAGSGGTLAPALSAIGDQCDPIIVVVRVAADADPAAQDANVIGATDGSIYTGIQALLAAETVVGVRPRILGAPGLDTQAVTAELAIAARKLRGFAYARAVADDVSEAVLYRDEFAARELMLIWPDSSADHAGDIIARAMGLRAQIDETTGWHKSISNVALSGVLGLTRDVHFDLLDPSTDAGVLNDAPVTTIIRAMGGYRLWGNRTTAGEDHPEFAFETAVRTSHALQDIMADAVAPFLDQPMTIALIKDMLETANTEFRQLAVEGKIVGARMLFEQADNSAAQLAAGRPTFRVEYTPAAPMENPTVNLVITDYFYTGFADQLV